MRVFEAIRRDCLDDPDVSIRELALRHGVHRRTVRQALASAEPPARKVPVRSAPVLDPVKPLIDAMLRQDLDAPRKQRHTALRIRERLIDEHQLVVAYSTVRDYVREARVRIAAGAGKQLAEVFVPQTHPAGAEAEVDFADLWIVWAGVKTKVFLFTLRLSYSGEAIHRAYATCSQEAFLDGHRYAFKQLGGIPTVHIRYDNLKAAVSRVLRPLPAEPFETRISLRPRVARHARVTVRQCQYSVPARLVGRQVRVLLRATTVQVFDGPRLVAEHERATNRGSVNASGPDRLVVLPSADHDFSRLACGSRSAEQLPAVFTFLLTWGSIPSIYYGDEIGLRYLDDMPDREGSIWNPRFNRAGCRTPMQWDNALPNEGFSTAATEAIYLPQDPAPGCPTVAAQRGDPGSVLLWVRELIELRRGVPALRPEASRKVLSAGYPLVFLRGDKHVVVVNPHRDPTQIQLDALRETTVTAVTGTGVTIDGGVVDATGLGHAIFEIDFDPSHRAGAET